MIYEELKKAWTVYLHTYTSTGLRVFGVMIQGEIWNTTVSVKTGVSGKPFKKTNWYLAAIRELLPLPPKHLFYSFLWKGFRV